ncbi:DUF2993 domain-containing protein [Gloeocapsa sp. PCC 73106]|uniref:LmeA family phospholipid-binding protein n=1 Tax=Gloeocapsa sp. PCC 73106 TaxID=102232 RepID=UPI0002AC19F5|nr:DUF2993 domain-containing protein [Gloeocapsa sp. PCC 73106]ELR97288.1 Protein of unknown function (DUF2993) [Gloeocapsa sp. PCC 73106]
MELITIFLASLIGMLSPSGVIAEQRIATAIRDRVPEVEYLRVRIDNRPTHRILKGKADQLKIAIRGLYLIPSVRIEALEIETDPFQVSFANSSPSTGDLSAIALQQPLQLGLRLVLTESDLKEALQSPVVQSYLEESVAPLPQAQAQNYRLVSFDVDLIGSERLRLNLQLEPVDVTNKEKLNILIDSGIAIRQGRRLELIEPVATINERKVSSRFLNRVVQRLTEDLDLKVLESEGITSRILQLEIKEDKLNLAAFVRMEQLPKISVE